ncbi:MAG TPA: CarD family transcriptional regulator [Bryobacteraceae bacterium]|nr:CarD family transcriptional regulator [Bryobacteraceae bacterium]
MVVEIQLPCAAIACGILLTRHLVQLNILFPVFRRAVNSPAECNGQRMTLFRIGEKVVYPNHGIGTVENISSRQFGCQQERFYLLRLVYTSMTVMVPFSHVEEIGLRRVTRNGEVARVLEFLAQGAPKCKGDWKDRFKENSDKMRHGSLLEIAEVLKTLLLLQSEKPLSFREKKMLYRARHMLVTELSISRGLPEYEVTDLLGKALAKASLPLPSPL